MTVKIKSGYVLTKDGVRWKPGMTVFMPQVSDDLMAFGVTGILHFTDRSSDQQYDIQNSYSTKDAAMRGLWTGLQLKRLEYDILIRKVETQISNDLAAAISGAANAD